MSTTIEALEKRVIELEAEIKSIRSNPFGRLRSYFIKFFQGHREELKIFLTPSGLNDAILEGRAHCDKMGYRFGSVRPAIVNLKHQEDLKFKSRGEWNEDLEEPQDHTARLERLKREKEEQAKNAAQD